MSTSTLVDRLRVRADFLADLGIPNEENTLLTGGLENQAADHIEQLEQMIETQDKSIEEWRRRL